MRIPIGPHQYDVRMVHGWVKGQAGEDCLGFFDATQHCIYISDQQSSSEMAVTLGHELMHAWRYHFPCDLNDEEALAEIVGLGFAQFMGAAMKQFADWGRMMGHPDFVREDAEAKMTGHQLQSGEFQSRAASDDVPQVQHRPKAQAARVVRRDGWEVKIYG